MKITDIRINNVIDVRYHHNDSPAPIFFWAPAIVKSISEKSITIETGMSVDFNGKNVRSRPISEEYLVFAGFEKVKDRSGVQAAYKLRGVRINISNSGNFYFNDTLIFGVHQLQNLFYALECVELNDLIINKGVSNG